jgi:hypothetical protein
MILLMLDLQTIENIINIYNMLPIQSIKGLQIVPPKNESGSYETAPDMPKMHQVCVIVGKRAAGKSVAAVNLIEKMGFDYSIVVSPTMSSNKELMSRLKIEHSFEDPDCPTTIDQIKEIVLNEAKDYERYKHEMKEYRSLMNDIKNGKSLDDNMLLKYFENNMNGINDFIMPKHRWGGRKPRIAVLFDDMLGSMMYSKPRKINALATYSRHLGGLKEGGSIGVSLFFLIQSFKCAVGGLNKVIRNQCTSLIMFKSKDLAEINDIADSCGGEISKDQFIKVYEEAIGDGTGYPFLFVDLHKKPEQPSMFRRRFDEYIIVPDLNKKDEIK